MRSKHFRLLCAVTILLMAIMACNFGTPGDSPTATVQPSETSLGNAPTDAPSPSETATPTSTEDKSTTETPTLTLEPSLTPTVEVPVAKVNKEVNCRTGPSGAYDLVVTFKAGDTVDVLARDLGAGYVFVGNPNEEGQGCWVLQSSLTITGNLTPLPAFTPLASPTLAPDFKITYKNIDKCKGNAYVRFIVTNTGSVQFRSAYVKVTNLKNNEVTEQVVSAFDIMTGCIVAQNISP